MMADEASETRPTKASLVADALRHEIVTGQRPPGSDLPPETQLMKRFGISRPSHREALRVLESEGLIRIARGARGGARVLRPELETAARHVGVYLQMRAITLQELFAARLTYEPAAAAAIAERRDPDALGALAQCAAAQEYSVHDRAAFNLHETAFRRLLLEHCGNAVLHLMGAVLEQVYAQHMLNVTRRAPHLDWEEEHLTDGAKAKARLVRLMAAGEPERARRAWETYIRIYWDRVAELVDRHSLIEVFAGDQPPPHPYPPLDDTNAPEGEGARR